MVKIGVDRKNKVHGMPEYYEIDERNPLASGSFGKVFRSGEYAIKEIDISKITKENDETKIQLNIRH